MNSSPRDAMVGPLKERAYEKYAWVILFANGLLWLLYSIAVLFLSSTMETPSGDAVKTLTGAPFSQIVASNPGIANYIYYLLRNLAIIIFGFGALLTVISATAYRKGAVWAWYLMWVAPVILLLQVPNDYFTVGSVFFDPTIFIVIPLVGLLLPYRKFFPKKQPA
jgi:hypothetical protein